MAKRVYVDMQNLSLNNKVDPADAVSDNENPTDLAWQGIEKDVKRFIWFNVKTEVKGGTYRTGLGWDTVTRAGALAKVQILFPGIDIQADENKWLNSLPTGVSRRLLTPRMQGMSTDMVGVGIGGF
jgi:hypothetical protein